MKFIGAHVSASGGVFNAPINATKIGAKAFALFTKNQRQWDGKALTQEDIARFKEELAKAGYEVKQREGYGLGSWVLLDFGDIIVHVFDRENRVFYDLERIWQDGKVISPEEL